MAASVTSSFLLLAVAAVLMQTPHLAFAGGGCFKPSSYCPGFQAGRVLFDEQPILCIGDDGFSFRSLRHRCSPDVDSFAPLALDDWKSNGYSCLECDSIAMRGKNYRFCFRGGSADGFFSSDLRLCEEEGPADNGGDGGPVDNGGDGGPVDNGGDSGDNGPIDEPPRQQCFGNAFWKCHTTGQPGGVYPNAFCLCAWRDGRAAPLNWPHSCEIYAASGTIWPEADARRRMKTRRMMA